MDVGILSMHRVPNYGSFWQAYCLKRMIKDCDSNPEFIDIIPGEIDTRTVYKKSFSFSKIKRIPYYYFQRNKKNMFYNYQSTVLECFDKPNYKCDYDAIIIGSDEVFNFVQESPWGFSTQLYGDIENDNVNSYAACFGNTTLKHIIETGRRDKISKALKNIQHLSVRDENSANIVEVLSGKRPEIHLDPVIVGDLPEKLPKIKDNNYILVYSYDFRLSDPNVVKQVKDIAKENNLKIISAGFYQEWVDKNVLPTPEELLSYFKNAELIITDTFHGTIFSARMHGKFLTVIRESNKQKLGDLLSRIGMEDRRYCEGDLLHEKFNLHCDYLKFEEFRTKEKLRTKAYLKQCLHVSK